MVRFHDLVVVYRSGLFCLNDHVVGLVCLLDMNALARYLLL